MDRGLQQHPPLDKTSLAAHPWQQSVTEEETMAAFGSTRTQLPPHLAAVAVAAVPERRLGGKRQRPVRTVSLYSKECRPWASIRLRRFLGQ